jgi:type I restriction enzyme S subunit
MEGTTAESVAGNSPLPDGWAQVRVDHAGAVRLGRQRSPDQHSGLYATKYVRAANITPTGLNLGDLLEMDFTPAERKVFALRSGDVLLTEASGSAAQVGRAAIWRGEIEPCCYQNTVIRFRPHLTTPEYALIVFKHYAAAGVFASIARGVGIQHLGASRFAELDFPLPPLAEQNRIAEVAYGRLDEIREAEARLRSALGRLGEQVKEILAAAVAGELVPQLHNPQADKVIGTAQTRDGQISLFEPVLPEMTELEGFDWSLPISWRWARIDEVGEAILGRQRSPQHHTGSHMHPYLRVANVLEDRIDLSDLKEMNFEPHEAEVYSLRKGDVLLNEGQSPELVGRAAIYRGSVPGLCFQNHLIRFRASEIVDPEFALLVFRHYLHAGIFRQIARWSTNIANMGLERFRSLPFPLPPKEEQTRIAAEARRRLDATTLQLDAVRASLSRLPDFERELFAAAVAGDLAPQNQEDEPAATVVERLGPAPRYTTESPTTRLTRGGSPVPKKRRKATQRSEPTPDLTAVLKAAGGALSLPELFAQAGYNRDQPEHVELFYLALRDRIGRTIRLTGEAAENATVEIVDAP